MFAASKTNNVATGGGTANYIEDVFSTYLYTGNGSIQGIPNGLNLGTNYGGSGYFNGSSSFLSVPASSSFTFTGDYTIEAWLFITGFPDNGNIFSTWTGGGGSLTNSFQFNYETTGTVYCADQPTPAGVITLNNWIHVAASRSGTTQKIFINGVVQSTATVSGTVSQAATAYIGKRLDNGNYVQGYISNLRVVKGTAVYTSDFTPSTIPLTAISGTVLLTCQANGFVDASTNAFTITNSNAVAVKTYGPFTSTTAGAGGLVWIKNRTSSSNHILARQPNVFGFSNLGDPFTFAQNVVFSYNSNGCTLGSDSRVNTNGANFVSWTFAKQPKFFDSVSFTGDGVAGRQLTHNLGSVPGCIFLKSSSNGSNRYTYHRILGASNKLNLNDTSASASFSGWNNTSPTASVFTVGGTGSGVNEVDVNYTAYLFAHNAGGFGLTGTDNVISCGSYTGTGSNPNSITFGYEPQWILLKKSSDAANWYIFDNMRGMPVGSADAYLFPNASDAESSTDAISPTATGFDVVATTGAFNQSGQTYIYIAIRRGPMKVPTVGTSVFSPQTYTAATTTFTPNFPLDLNWDIFDRGTGGGIYWGSRLQGDSKYLVSASTAAEGSYPSWQYGLGTGTFQQTISTGTGNGVEWMFRRAPSFFDEVCYTGVGGSATVSHNLGVVPEMMIVKCRSNSSTNWIVYVASEGAGKAGYLNLIDEFYFNGYGSWNDTAPTSSIFTVGPSTYVNGSGRTYVNYLFATCAGVSKVGSYTGNGTTQTINCSFTTGARFVLIKRTDSTGGWYVYDTARGMTTLTDPYLFLNSTAAETATLGSVTTVSTGFALNSTILAAINVSGGSYIFLAIA